MSKIEEMAGAIFVGGDADIHRDAPDRLMWRCTCGTMTDVTDGLRYCEGCGKPTGGRAMCTSASKESLVEELRRLDRVRHHAEQSMAEVQGSIDRLEAQRFVGVQFHGNSRVYTYELQDGPIVDIGDYLKVYSPRTEQEELVRVVRRGRGSWRLVTKIAHRIEIVTVD